MKKESKVKILIITLITSMIMWVSSITIYSNVCAPKFYDYLIDTGVKYLMGGKYEEAILTFTKAIEIGEKSTDARVYLAEGYIGNNEIDKSIEVLKEAQEIDITNEELLKEILEILNDIDADIAYEFLDRFIQSVGKDNISVDIKDIFDTAYESPQYPMVNPEPGTYVKPISFRIKQDKIKVGHSYYYTIDGSEPNKNSKKYKGKINIDKTTTIKLIGYNKNNESTESITLEYIIDKNILENLKSSISEGEKLIKGTTVGTEIGNILEEDKNKLQKIIEDSKVLLNKKILSYEEAIDTNTKIESSIKEFKENILKPTDKSELKKTIEKAQSLYNNSTEGTKEGQYKSGAKGLLLQAIKQSLKIYDNKVSKQSEIDKQVSILKNEIGKFENSKNIDLSKLRNKYTNKIKDLEYKEDNLFFDDYLSNYDMGNMIYNIYYEYEGLLNSMNLDLEKSLPQNKVYQVQEFKNKWTRRKNEVDRNLEAGLLENNGTWIVTGAPEAYIRAINEHCYEIINTLMK